MSKIIKVTDEYSLHKYKYGWKVVYKSIEKFEKTWKGKKEFHHKEFDKYYGNLSQALQALLLFLLDDSVDTLDNIPHKISVACRAIDAALSEIDDKYKIINVVK